jgi:hypothetical protein
MAIAYEHQKLRMDGTTTRTWPSCALHARWFAGLGGGAEVGECCATHVPLGGMTVKAGLGGTVTSALLVAGVSVELKSTISPVNCESAGVVVHGARRIARGMRSDGRCRCRWDEEKG